MNWKQIKELREQRADLLKQAETLLDTATTETRDLSDEEQTQFDDLHSQAQALAKRIGVGEKHLDATNALPERRDLGKGDPTETPEGTAAPQADNEQRAVTAFESWIRTGESTELRALATTPDTSGGYAVPKVVHQNILTQLRSYDAFRRAGATEINVSNSGPYDVPLLLDEANAGGSAGENNAAGTGEPVFDRANLLDRRFDSKSIPVSEQMLSQGSLEPILYNLLAERIALAEQRAFTSGDDTFTPTTFEAPAGLLNEADTGVTVSASGTIGYDDLIDLMHSVPQAYRTQPSVGWMMADSTLAELRKVKDGEDRPIFVPAPNDTTPDRLLGKPVIVNDDFPVFAAGKKPIAFGKFASFWIKNAGGVRIKRDPFTQQNKDQVVFDGFANAGAGLTDKKAIKLLAVDTE
jgi:HK97 family phage major capsid protein